ncbi:helix-turn-helix transcriptional regulator [Betaproteobacteria bacterium SCN2]|nr:helix-turn-helix transcriptional regulator [Betaproteobacteria bacterium SCN2]
MAKKPTDEGAARNAERYQLVSIDAAPLVTLKDLRKRAQQTQEDLAVALAVGQDTISRLEKRSDMLLSTLRQYVESVGGRLALVATFPDQPPVIINPVGSKKRKAKKRRRSQTEAGRDEP